jgi:glycosyltransferase involved in cell wall biosynthesis
MQRLNAHRESPFRRVLLVSRPYYPCNAIGSHRAGKLAKYLPEFGWWPTVVTVEVQHYLSLGATIDSKLLSEIPEGVEVLRTGYLSVEPIRRLYRLFRRRRAQGGAVGDSVLNKTSLSLCSGGLSRWIETPGAIGWLPFALQPALGQARRSDVVWATTPPEGGLCVGALVSLLSGKPLVVDFRDPWNSGAELPTRYHRWWNRQWERFVLRTASCIVVVTDVMRASMIEAWPSIAGKVRLIYNGYDSDDVDSIPLDRSASAEVIRIGYFGSVYRGRESHLASFLRAVRAWNEAPDGRRPIRFVCRGPSPDVVVSLSAEAGCAMHVDSGPVVPYRQALQLMGEMDVLLILGSEHHGYSLPGKLFEYIGARRPVLGLTPPGALSTFLTRHGVGVPVASSEVSDILHALDDLMIDSSGFVERLNRASCRFTRRAIACEYANVLDEVSVAARSTRRSSV